MYTRNFFYFFRFGEFILLLLIYFIPFYFVGVYFIALYFTF